MSAETTEYTFHRQFTGDTLFNRLGKIIYSCRLYEVRDDAGIIVAKYFAGDVDSIIELPGKLYTVKDDSGFGNRKKTITVQPDSGEQPSMVQLNFWNMAGTISLNKNEQYSFKQTNPKLPLLNNHVTERQYLLSNESVNIAFCLTIPFPGSDGRTGASPADGKADVPPGKILLALFGLVMMEMIIRGYELNSNTG